MTTTNSNQPAETTDEALARLEEWGLAPRTRDQWRRLAQDCRATADQDEDAGRAAFRRMLADRADQEAAYVELMEHLAATLPVDED